MGKQASKREQREAWKARKAASKLVRREAKLARRIGRREQRVTVESRTTMDAEAAARVLEGLAASLRQGTITAERGDESLTLSPPATFRVDVRARQDHKCEKLSIRLRWPRDDREVEAPPVRLSPPSPR